MTEYKGADEAWKTGFGDDYNTFVVYADGTDIATYRVHDDGALERLWAHGPIAMHTPMAVASRESAMRQCTEAWENHLANPPEPIGAILERIWSANKAAYGQKEIDDV